LKVSLNWLREFIDIPLDVEELSNRLTMQGIAVDEIENERPDMEGVVVARVIAVERHPNADRLVVCQVDAGKVEPFRVVCGAPNVRAEGIYPFAPPGARLPGGAKIKKVTIRGERSSGMLCSGLELGISTEGDRILDLDPSMNIGEDVVNALNLADVILDIDVTANRFDLLSHLGVAREIRAIVGGSLRLLESNVAEAGDTIAGMADVHIEDEEGCPRYMARVMRGVSVRPSPLRLIRRLESLGMRSVNNVVDTANLVMLELGHPIHTFDLETICDHKIIVRRGGKGERMMSLDGEERTLDSETVVIADAKKPVAIAGIMGSLDTEVRDDTADLLIECAHFDPIRIRRSSRRLGLPSQASFRFERWVDPNFLPFAINRVAFLIQELAGGEVCRGVIDRYPRRVDRTKIDLRPDRVEMLLGTKIETARMETLLERIDLPVQKKRNILQVDVPTFRRDLTREVDLIEEIARLEGYEKVEVSEDTGSGIITGIDREERKRNKLKMHLMSHGFREVYTSSFLSPDEIALLFPDLDHDVFWNLRNPISSDESVLRPSLLPGLLRVLKLNVSRNNPDLRIFEFGTVFSPRAGNETAPRENISVAGLMAGRKAPIHWGEKGEVTVGFFDMKGVLSTLLRNLGYDRDGYRKTSREVFHPGRNAAIEIGGQEIGCIGELHPSVAEDLALPNPPMVFEIDGKVLGLSHEQRNVPKMSVFPSVKRDLSLLVPVGITYQILVDGIQSAGGDLLEEVTLYDVYRGPQVPENQEALTFSLVFRSPQRTLVDEEIDDIMSQMIERLNVELDVTLRPSV
jgi:phenylalanyl-tRNA synthetase beta chain